MSQDWSAAGPEAMRQRLADYVYAVHAAYLKQADLLAPGERAQLPLVATAADQPLTVAVAAAQELHLIATVDPLPAPRGQEVALRDELNGVTWEVRFYDVTILPELGIAVPADQAAEVVRRVLGVANVSYHLSVSPGGGLTEHHAQHAGVALANQHALAVREGQSLRAAYARSFPGAAELVDEFVLAERLGMKLSARLLAQELARGHLTGEELEGEPANLRRRLLTLAKER